MFGFPEGFKDWCGYVLYGIQGLDLLAGGVVISIESCLNGYALFHGYLWTKLPSSNYIESDQYFL